MKFTTFFAAACAILPAFGASLPVEENALEERASSSLTILTGAVNKVLAANTVVDNDVSTSFSRYRPRDISSMSNNNPRMNCAGCNLILSLKSLKTFRLTWPF